MPKKNAANNAKYNNVALTEEQLVNLERETVVKLSEVLPVWYQQLGPGLDTVFAGLGLMLQKVDQVAGTLERANASDFEIRTQTVREMGANLAIPKRPALRSQQNARLKALGSKENAKSEMDYEAKTLRLIAEDFPAWYDEAGFGGFVGSLAELLKIFSEVFHGILDDQSVERDKVFFLTAFEMRQRFGKVPKEMLEALEMLGELEAGKKAAA